MTRLERRTRTETEASFRRFPAPAVEQFCGHISETAAAKPWVLIAYAWVFYMAIFSGGRWIRSELQNAGHEFWLDLDGKAAGSEKESSSEEEVDEEDDEVVLVDSEEETSLPLSFLDFPGEEDGEDIKRDFKARLLSAEEILTPEQREDIAQEAKEIFQYSIRLVEELDEVCGTAVTIANEAKKETAKGSHVAEDVAPSGSLVGWNKDGWKVSDLQGFAGAAVLVSCVSWYVLYGTNFWA